MVGVGKAGQPHRFTSHMAVRSFFLGVMVCKDIHEMFKILHGAEIGGSSVVLTRGGRVGGRHTDAPGGCHGVEAGEQDREQMKNLVID